MILEIDAGNSRLKWRVRASAGPVLYRGWCAALDPLPEPSPWRDYGPEWAAVGSVAGADFDARLRARLEAEGARVRFARSGKRCGRLRAGYYEPARMGVDRWLALVAAAAQWSGALVMIDAGSAMTLDLVAADGGHCGGYIVPGLRMLETSLLGGTRGVRFEAEACAAALGPGRSTQEAVTHGALAMVSDFVRNRVRVFAASTGARAPHVVMTGGDAATLSAWLPEAEYAPELVLDGLARVLDVSASAQNRSGGA